MKPRIFPLLASTARGFRASSALAIAISAAFAGTHVMADTSFTTGFDGPALDASLETTYSGSGSLADPLAGTAVTTGNTYVGTVESDYAVSTNNWTATIEVQGSGNRYFGLGTGKSSGQGDPGYGTPQGLSGEAAAYTMLYNASFVDGGDRSVQTQRKLSSANYWSGETNYNDAQFDAAVGTSGGVSDTAFYRYTMTYDSAAQTLTFDVDQISGFGGTVTSSGAGNFGVMSLAGMGYTASTGRIFFGGEGTFDNFSVNVTPPSPITSGTWTNTAGGQWSTAGNWLDNIVANGSGATADFSTLNITADTTVNLDSARTVSDLFFGDTDTSSAAGWTLANNGNAGNILTLVDTPTVMVDALGDTKTATISAAVGGSAGLTKAGTGTLTLSAANTYSGTTTVSEGTLLVSGQPYFNIGRTTSIASGAVFELSNSVNDLTTLMPVSTITGAGIFRLSGNSTINQSLNGVTGTRLTIDMQAGGLIDLLDTSRLTNGGWQELNWTSNQASMNIASGATLDIWDGQDVTIDALNGSGTVDKVHPDPDTFMLNIGVAGGSGTFSGTIQNTSGAGAIALIKAGSGTQTLSGTNTYSGNTTVEAGTLSIPSGGSLRFYPTTGGATNSLSGTASATLTYLGTVNLDLSAAQTIDGNFWTLVDVGSFSGPAPTLAPEAVTSTLGAFIETPVDSGTWELSVTGAKWTFDEGDGSLTYTVTATPYDTWATSFDPDIGLPAEDDDNDGVTNFEEFAFGLLPNSGSSVNPISAQLDKTTGAFSYTRRATPAATGLTYTVRSSTTLAAGEWTNLVKDTDYTESISTLGDIETVTVTLIPAPTAAKLFIQVRAD